jgi:fructokinase
MKETPAKLYGGIEAGGTKFVCAVGAGPADLCAVEQFPTTLPPETLRKVIDFFKFHSAQPLASVGIASFGPLNLDPKSPCYGYITNTPKEGWSRANLAGLIRQALGVPVFIDTDVNGAALAEQKWGAARGLDTFIYLTIGTGIGGGGIVNGHLMHGLVHPEMGHMRIPHDPQSDPFEGSCSFHKDCWEGLASGESLEKRWGKRPEDLPLDHPAWELEAGYISLGVANLIYTLSPQRIILGGGILKNPGLLPAVQDRVKALLNNYVSSSEIIDKIGSYLVPPGLGNLSGVLGAIALAQPLQ